MTQEFVTLPRHVAEHAVASIEILNAGKWTQVTALTATLRAALEQPQNHVPDAGNMVPAGWKLVPVEPTRDMLTTWIKAPVVSNTTAPGLYRAMLSAAQQTPVVDQPQGEQEPVGCITGTYDGYPVVRLINPALVLPFGTALYTHPQPKREPLTDKQISRLWSDAHNDTTDRMAFQVLARAVEAAHNIK